MIFLRTQLNPDPIFSHIFKNGTKLLAGMYRFEDFFFSFSHIFFLSLFHKIDYYF